MQQYMVILGYQLHARCSSRSISKNRNIGCEFYKYGDHCIKTYQEYSDLIINDILKLLHIIDYFNCKQNTTLINKYRLRVVLVSMSLIIYKATPDIYHHLLLETPTFTRQHHAKVS